MRGVMVLYLVCRVSSGVVCLVIGLAGVPCCCICISVDVQ